MAGFSNVPPASEFRKATSWGRTRQPKNLNGPSSTAEVTFSTDAPTAVTDGYATENQRYLHLRFNRSQVGARTITVWAWSHAFGAWAPLTDLTGTAVTLTCNDQIKHRVFEISGVDRVYFQPDSTLHGDDTLHAAGSTF